MKNPHWVSFSPAFHWTDQKLRVHVFYCVLALLLSSLLQRKAAHGGHLLTIEQLLAELSGVTEVVNLYAAPEPATRGRYRAQYVLSERSSLQDKLLPYTNTPIPDSTTVSVYKPRPTGYRAIESFIHSDQIPEITRKLTLIPTIYKTRLRSDHLPASIPLSHR